MGHDCIWVTPKGETKDAEFYISYNHSVFSDYWHISQACGHKGSTILRQLKKVIHKLAEEGVRPEINKGEDVWTKSKDVFLFHLVKLAIKCEKNMENRLYSDCEDVVVKFTDDGYESDGEQKPKIRMSVGPIKDYGGIMVLGNVSWYQHEKYGKIKVHDYATAKKAYEYAKSKGDSRAGGWLLFANSFRKDKDWPTMNSIY